MYHSFLDNGNLKPKGLTVRGPRVRGRSVRGTNCPGLSGRVRTVRVQSVRPPLWCLCSTDHDIQTRKCMHDRIQERTLQSVRWSICQNGHLTLILRLASSLTAAAIFAHKRTDSVRMRGCRRKKNHIGTHPSRITHWLADSHDVQIYVSFFEQDIMYLVASNCL